MKPLKRLKRTHDDRGAVAVEFALIVPVLLMLVFGAIQYGRVYSQLEVFESAAREGARVAATRGTSGEIVTAITTAAQPYTLSGTPSANMVCTVDTVGSLVTVGWTQTLAVDIPLIPTLNVSRRVEGTFRCE